MDKTLKDAIEAAKAQKIATQKANAEAERKRHDDAKRQLDRRIEASMEAARQYVKTIVIPKVAEMEAENQFLPAERQERKIVLGSMMSGIPIDPPEALVKAVNEIEGLRAYRSHHDGGYVEGYGYDSYDFVEISWTRA